MRVFLIGLVDWRRLLSLRNLDLLMMLSFSVSLWFFNRGHIFAAMPLVYPGLALAARPLPLDRPQRSGAARLDRLAGLGADRRDRVPRPVSGSALNVARLERDRRRALRRDRSRADRDRPVDPYGNFPIEGNRPACGPADASGEIRDRIQTNGRCEAADAQGDTYGPVSYEAYLPGYWVFGWSGKWDTLPAAHATSILWDSSASSGSGSSGCASAGARLAATLAFAWAAWPFSQYASNSNTNDMIQPALLIFGFYFLSLAGATRCLRDARRTREVRAAHPAPALVGLPGFARQPLPAALRRRGARRGRGRVLRSCSSTAHPLHDAPGLHPPHLRLPVRPRLARSRSGTGGSTTRRGCRTSLVVQHVLQVGLLVVGALALYRWPRHRSPLQIAAFTGALLVGFELVLTTGSTSTCRGSSRSSRSRC